MIGYYVHHHGRGHLHRATAVAQVLAAAGHDVTGLSSLARPDGWPGSWVRLARDDEAPEPAAPTAGGRLHWVPLRDDGLRERMAAIAAFLATQRPDVLVVDVSVEVCLLARLHGVPVLSVVLPGVRDDAAHRLGFDVADELVGFWPPDVEGMLHGLGPEVVDRVRPLGALSRHPCVDRPGPASRTVVLLAGTGGSGVSADDVAAARSATPSWRWTVLGGPAGTWVDDPAAAIAAADVVVTHAGQNALAEVAAARRPAVVLPQARPHAEQVTTGSVLRRHDLPAVVLDRWPTDWPVVLEQAASLDGSRWARWCDGGAAERFADAIVGVADHGSRR